MKIVPSLRQKKILITCGPTWVPIDGMRVISNRSSGKLGQKLALALARLRANVTVLEGPVEQRLAKTKGVTVRPHYFFDELKQNLYLELRNGYDAVIHAAAVSDYKLKQVAKGKLASNLKQLRLELVPTEKLIRGIKKQAPKTFLVGFKLEFALSGAGLKKKVAAMMHEARCDALVVNSLTDGYRGYVVEANGCVSALATTREQIIKKIITILKERL